MNFDSATILDSHGRLIKFDDFPDEVLIIFQPLNSHPMSNTGYIYYLDENNIPQIDVYRHIGNEKIIYINEKYKHTQDYYTHNKEELRSLLKFDDYIIMESGLFMREKDIFPNYTNSNIELLKKI